MMARLYLALGVAYVGIGRYKQALTLYNQALDHWRSTNNLIRQATLLNHLSVIYHQTGNYKRAASTLEKALIYAQQSGYKRIEGLYTV